MKFVPLRLLQFACPPTEEGKPEKDKKKWTKEEKSTPKLTFFPSQLLFLTADCTEWGMDPPENNRGCYRSVQCSTVRCRGGLTGTACEVRIRRQSKWIYSLHLIGLQEEDDDDDGEFATVGEANLGETDLIGRPTPGEAKRRKLKGVNSIPHGGDAGFRLYAARLRDFGGVICQSEK